MKRSLKRVMGAAALAAALAVPTPEKGPVEVGTAVTLPTVGNLFTQIAAGTVTSSAIGLGGRSYIWGDSMLGQIGEIGNPTNPGRFILGD